MQLPTLLITLTGTGMVLGTALSLTIPTEPGHMARQSPRLSHTAQFSPTPNTVYFDPPQDLTPGRIWAYPAGHKAAEPVPAYLPKQAPKQADVAPRDGAGGVYEVDVSEAAPGNAPRAPASRAASRAAANEGEPEVPVGREIAAPLQIGDLGQVPVASSL